MIAASLTRNWATVEGIILGRMATETYVGTCGAHIASVHSPRYLLPYPYFSIPVGTSSNSGRSFNR